MLSHLTPGALALLLLGVVVAAALVQWGRQRPKFVLAGWLFTAAFVPFWVRISALSQFMPTTLVGVLAAAALYGARRRRFNGCDLVLLCFFLSCLAPLLTGGATSSTIFGALTQWLLAYLLGRFAPARISTSWIYSCIAVIFTVVAALAIIEFLFHWNPFSAIGPDNALHAKWAPRQGRGNLIRSEGAFGHSIALGCCLALAIAPTLATTFRPVVKLAMLALMLGGVAVTLSRISMVCAALSVLVMVLFVPSGLTVRIRLTISGLFAVAALALYPFLNEVFAAAGSEATNSAGYRESLTSLIPEISILGISSSAYRDSAGDLYFGHFQSIDSQLLFTGLTYGWFALICGLVPLLAACVVVARRRATAATVAMVAQIPALATVALITQYSMFLWFIAGLAVATQVHQQDDDAPSLAGGGRGSGAPAPATAERHAAVMSRL